MQCRRAYCLKVFDWHYLNNWLFMWSETHVRQIGSIRYATSFTRPNSYHCCVRLHLNSGGIERSAHRPTGRPARLSRLRWQHSRPITHITLIYKNVLKYRQEKDVRGDTPSTITDTYPPWMIVRTAIRLLIIRLRYDQISPTLHRRNITLLYYN